MKLPALAFALMPLAAAQTPAQTKAQLDAAQADRTAIAEQASQQAIGQTAVAVAAAGKAAAAADSASQAARDANSGSRNLIIIQAFSLLSLIMGFVYKTFERRGDVKETMRKEGVAEQHRLDAVEEMHAQRAQLQQIHTLVNSNLTAAKQDQLDTLRANLALLLEVAAAARLAGHQPTIDTLGAVDATKLKIGELSVELAERQVQTADAAARLQSDLASPRAKRG